MKRWFMSYVMVYGAHHKFCHNVYEGNEHPVAKIARWTATHGKTDGFTAVLLSFQEVGPEVPEADVMTVSIWST
jgi:hypothetical protein